MKKYGRYFSAMVRENVFGEIKYSFQLEYFIGKKTYPPTIYPNAWPTAFDTLENAKEFIKHRHKTIRVLEIFEADSPKIRPITRLAMVTPTSMESLWSRSGFVLYLGIPKGGIFCNNITLIKEIKN